MRILLTRRIRGVVFDLDNTLIQSRRGARRALNTAAEIITDHLSQNGHSYTKTGLLRRLQKIEQNRKVSRSALDARTLYNRDKWWRLLLKELGLSRLQGPWIHKATLRYWDVYMDGSPPFADAEPTLKKLKREGMKLGIVSDSDGTPGVKRLRAWKLSFRPMFDTVIVAGEDTPKVKPSKAPFLQAARNLGLSPEEIAYVGDNPTTDVEGAKTIGMLTFLVRRRSYMAIRGLQAGQPTYEVRSLKEIPRLLPKLSG